MRDAAWSPHWEPQPTLRWTTCAHFDYPRQCAKPAEGWALVRWTGGSRWQVPMCEEHGNV